MGVRANQYARELEKNIGKGRSLKKAHKRSAALSSVTRKVDKYDKPSLADRGILAALRAYQKYVKRDTSSGLKYRKKKLTYTRKK